MRKLFVLVTVLPILLVGCVTQEEQMKMAFDQFSPVCEKVGYKIGTVEHGQCVLTLIENDKTRRANASAALMGLSRGLLQQSQPVPTGPAQTNCYRAGPNNVNCLTY